MCLDPTICLENKGKLRKVVELGITKWENPFHCKTNYLLSNCWLQISETTWFSSAFPAFLICWFSSTLPVFLIYEIYQILNLIDLIIKVLKCHCKHMVNCVMLRTGEEKIKKKSELQGEWRKAFPLPMKVCITAYFYA